TQGAGGSISAGAGSSVSLTAGGTISGGIIASGAGIMNITSGNLSGVTIASGAVVNVVSAGVLGLGGATLTNNGSPSVTGAASGGALVGTGSLTITNTGSFKLAASTGLSRQNFLTINSGGKFDIANNQFAINYSFDPTLPAEILANIKTGYNG